MMKIKKKLLIFAVIFFIFFMTYFVVIHFKIKEHSKLPVPEKADFIIILGARVKGDVPSLSLQYRIDAAADYMKVNKDTITIASGGKGSGEDISEAQAIKRELLKQGIEEHRILIEDQSTDTVENIKFSMGLIPSGLKTGLLVTNDYHLFRAKSIAKDQGITLGGLPAKTPTLAIPKSYSREYLAITKYYLVKFFEKK